MHKEEQQNWQHELEQAVLVLKLLEIVNTAVYDWLIRSKNQFTDFSVQKLIDDVIANRVSIRIEGHTGKLIESNNKENLSSDPQGWRLLQNFKVMAEKDFYRDLTWCKKNSLKHENSSDVQLEIEKINTWLLLKVFFLVFGLAIVGNISIEEIEKIAIE